MDTSISRSSQHRVLRVFAAVIHCANALTTMYICLSHSFAHFICQRHSGETMKMKCLPSHTHTRVRLRFVFTFIISFQFRKMWIIALLSVFEANKLGECSLPRTVFWWNFGRIDIGSRYIGTSAMSRCCMEFDGFWNPPESPFPIFLFVARILFYQLTLHRRA